MENKDLLVILKESPLFNLSLSSKELFHSNFLWWLGSNERTFPLFKQVMERFVGMALQWTFDNISVEREKKHIDLCVRNKADEKPLLILENKVKSIPNKEQLKEYYEKEPKAENYVLLSLVTEFLDKTAIENISENGNKKWKICSYADFAEALKIIPDGLTQYERELISDYRTFILSLHELAQQWIGNVKADNLFKEEKSNKIEECRLHDLYDKLRYSQLALMLQKRLNRTDVYVKTGYSNKFGIMEVTIPYEDHQLIIQVQGNSYRHAYVYVGEDKGQKWRDCLWKRILKEDKVVRKINFLSSKEADFGSDKLFKDGIYPITNSKKGKQYNAFVGKNDVFIYQSRQFRPDTTIGELLENICNEVESICSLNYK